MMSSRSTLRVAGSEFKGRRSLHSPLSVSGAQIPGPSSAFAGDLDTNAFLARMGRHASLMMAQVADHRQGHDAIGGLSRGTRTSWN